MQSTSFIESETARTATRFRELPPGWRVKDQTDACRSAALTFAWCARVWGKRELARWLIGPYARAIGAARERSARIPRRRVDEPLAEDKVRDVVQRSYAQLIDLLRTCDTWRETPGFAKSMIDEGLVVGVIDEDSALGYAPVSSASMRLVDRVRSLFVADFLTRPDDYARFKICVACDGVTFDRYNEHGETCSTTPPPASTLRVALRPRPDPVGERRVTLVGLGGRAA